jgi:hypothetical protein
MSAARSIPFSLAVALVAGCASPPGPPAENALTEAEREDGWRLLFDGKTLDGWMTSGRKPSRTPVVDGSIDPHGCGDYMMVYGTPLADFILRLDFKISKGCNSGIFLRTWPLEPLPGKDVGYNGLEVAVDDTPGAGFTDTGALYDLSRPTKNAMKPPLEWNRIEIACRGSRIAVELNGEKVNDVDLSKFTEPGKRPDGTAHKFDLVFRDHPREGYIGLQDHGSDCWYRNIKLKVLR